MEVNLNKAKIRKETNLKMILIFDVCAISSSQIRRLDIEQNQSQWNTIYNIQFNFTNLFQEVFI
jgi:hypothetical protein